MHSENWDDLRYVLAVAEEGSVSQAARRLGVNHATVLRRVAAFEERFGLEMFEKSSRGYTIPADRLRLIDAAREVESAVRGVERLISGRKAPLSGVVRITSSDSFSYAVLPRVVADLQKKAQGLKIEILSTNAHLDLQRLHADIALRPAQVLPDDLRGEHAANCGFAAYTAPDGVDHWLGLSGPLARSGPAAWLADQVDPATILGAADSFMVLREMAALGQGRAVLPCVLGDSDPRLTRIEGIRFDPIPLWVASHVDLYDAPRLSRVRRHIVEALRAQADALAGTL